jgi:hypothetical protein
MPADALPAGNPEYEKLDRLRQELACLQQAGRYQLQEA